MVNTGDIDAFVEHIEMLISDKNLRLKMAETARNVAITNYNSDKIVPLYVNYYNKILK